MLSSLTRRNTEARFSEAEEVIVGGNRAVALWIYRKIRNGQPWHLRGGCFYGS